MNLPVHRRFRLALTGGMGCGKSTVGRLLADRGWRRDDADEVIHQKVFKDPVVLGEAVRLFGAGAVVAGELERRWVGQRVFADADLLAAWEAVVHPRLRAYWEVVGAEPDPRPWVIEVPLLFEKGLEKGFDFVVCVASSRDQQLVRLEERGLSRALAEQRIQRQWPLLRKMELAQAVLWNDGSPSFLEAQVDHLLRRLR